MLSPEQREFNFEEPGKKPEQVPAEIAPEIEIHERDECQACGNMFESPGSCVQCAGNKIKRKWLNEQKRRAN